MQGFALVSTLGMPPMPFVQLFTSPLSGAPDIFLGGPGVTAAGVAEILATALDCAPDDIVVQTFTAVGSSSPSAIAIIRGRPRPLMEEAVASLEGYIVERLGLNRSSVLVRFEPTAPPPPLVPPLPRHTAERSD